MRKGDDGDWGFIRHIPCPACGSRDNRALYRNGNEYCHGCGDFTPGDGEPPEQPKERRMTGDLITPGEPVSGRGISEKTYRLFGYCKGVVKSERVHIAPYRDSSGQVVAQHLRWADKRFAWRGDTSDIELFGQHLWKDGGRMVVVTEGEVDAMSVAEVQDRKWPVVSIWCGAAKPDSVGKVERHIAKYVDWLCRFETVVFMFDMDEQGQASAIAAAKMLPPGKAKIATLPLHDANDMLTAGRGAEIVSAIWNARAYRPDGLVSVADIAERAKKPIELGLPWPWPQLTKLTFGRRPGEIYGIGAGTGIGKSDFLAELILTNIELGLPTAVFMFEASPVDIVHRVLGKMHGKTFHIPDSGWTQAELEAAVDALSALSLLTIYDHQGASEWDEVEGHIRYCVQHLGTKHVILDPLTAFTAHMDDESAGLKALMEKLSSLSKNLECSIYFVSHLSTPEGKPHEEGGRVTIRHFRGSRAIGYWANFLFGLERDQQAEDDVERRTTTVRVLKDRYTGRSTGQTFELLYAPETGRLREKDNNPFGDDIGSEAAVSQRNPFGPSGEPDQRRDVAGGSPPWLEPEAF